MRKLEQLKLQVSLLVILTLIEGVIIGWLLFFVDRIVPVEVEKLVTQNITEYVDRVVIKEVPYPVRVEVPYELSSNTISLSEVLAILTMAKAPHAYMVLHPELQNASTGNTTFNQEWMDNYDKVDNFIKWQTNRIKELEVGR